MKAVHDLTSCFSSGSDSPHRRGMTTLLRGISCVQRARRQGGGYKPSNAMSWFMGLTNVCLQTPTSGISIGSTVSARSVYQRTHNATRASRLPVPFVNTVRQCLLARRNNKYIVKLCAVQSLKVFIILFIITIFCNEFTRKAKSNGLASVLLYRRLLCRSVFNANAVHFL